MLLRPLVLAAWLLTAPTAGAGPIDPSGRLVRFTLEPAAYELARSYVEQFGSLDLRGKFMSPSLVLNYDDIDAALKATGKAIHAALEDKRIDDMMHGYVVYRMLQGAMLTDAKRRYQEQLTDVQRAKLKGQP